MSRIKNFAVAATMLVTVQLVAVPSAWAAQLQRSSVARSAPPKGPSLEHVLASASPGLALRVHRQIGISDFAAWAPNPVIAADAYRAMSKRPGFVDELAVWTPTRSSAEIIEEVFSFPVASDAQTFITGERRVLGGRHFPGATSSIEAGLPDGRRFSCRTANVMADFPVVFGIPAGVRREINVVTFPVGRSAVTLLFVTSVGKSSASAKARHSGTRFTSQAMAAFAVHEDAVLTASRFGDSGFPTVEATTKKDRIAVVVVIIVGAAVVAGITSRRQKKRSVRSDDRSQALYEPPFPANWYPDPSRAEGLRYWDGWAWTDERARRLDPIEPLDEIPGN